MFKEFLNAAIFHHFSTVQNLSTAQCMHTVLLSWYHGASQELPELPLNFFEPRYVELARRIAPPKGDGKFGYTPVVQRRKGGRGWRKCQELIDGVKLMSFVATRLSESPDVSCLSIFMILMYES